MAFDGYLTLAQSQTLIVAASDAGVFNVPRAQLLSGLPPLFAATLPIWQTPADQFQGDLGSLNLVERLADGSVPIVTYLSNIAFQLKLRSRPEEALFREAANGIGNRAQGVPDQPAPAQLKEIVDNEQIIAEDDTVGIGFLRAGNDVARAVARIAVPRFDGGQQVMLDNGSPWVLLGTSWLIGPGLALTNRHVINARRSDEPPASEADMALQATHATLEFGFDAAGAAVTTADVTRLVAVSSQLDYALLEVSGAPAVPIPRLRAIPVTVTPTSRMSVNIIQHPRGEPKQIAFRNNLVSAADAEIVRYFTDTDYGSSGSPVCDDSWRVVALHRGARHTDAANYQGRTEAFVNIGSQIQAVLADIATADAAAASAINGAQAGPGP